MSKNKIGFLAAAAMLVGTTAMASTITVMAQDIDFTGDDTAFMISNNSDRAISMISFDVTAVEAGRFNRPNSTNDPDGDGLVEALTRTDVTVDFLDTSLTAADTGADTLKLTFGNGLLGDFNFAAWVQFITGEPGSGVQGGIGPEGGDKLFASIVFVDGGTIDGRFDPSLPIENQPDVFKTSLELDVVPAVPLPASGLLLIGGLAGLGAIRKRKKTA